MSLYLRISFLLLYFPQLFMAQRSDDLIGYYMSPQANSIFKCFKNGDTYSAVPVWMRYPNRKDSLNPDKTKRNEKIVGSVVGWNFKYNGDNTWNSGYLYDSNSGKVYKSKITRDEKGNLCIRGYIGISLIGRTEYFVKVDYKEQN